MASRPSAYAERSAAQVSIASLRADAKDSTLTSDVNHGASALLGSSGGGVEDYTLQAQINAVSILQVVACFLVCLPTLAHRFGASMSTSCIRSASAGCWRLG